MPKKSCDVDECETPHYALGLCKPHYDRNRKHGDPTAGGPVRGAALAWLRGTVAALVAEPSADCVLHSFGPGKDGYGSVYLDGRRMGLHRAAMILAGKTPAARGGHTRHLCGNVACVNPAHIVAGTALENAADREAHGRTARGMKTPQCKLTDDQVREIRASNEFDASIAKRLGVDKSTIFKIRQGKQRKNVV